MKQTQQCLILYLLYLCILNDNNREKFYKHIHLCTNQAL